jgi:hypothetical protein
MSYSNVGKVTNQFGREPEVETIRLIKSFHGMGLSIEAAKGQGKDRMGIYIKSVVEGGAAWFDGRLKVETA